MNRPLLLRLGPDRFCNAVFARFYRKMYRKWLPLYESATLRFAPGVSMVLVPGDVISDYIAFTGSYEFHLSRHVARLARRGGTLIDIGANLGYFSLLWASSRQGNTCIAFEASPRNIEILRRNVRRNGLDPRIQVVPSAVGSAPGKLRFDPGPENQTGWGGFTLEDNSRAIDVDVVRVDDIVREDQPIALLKIDIEGAELWALRGCERLLKAGVVREIWYEQFKPRMTALGISIDDVQKYLLSVGYISTPRSDPDAELVDWSAVRA